MTRTGNAVSVVAGAALLALVGWAFAPRPTPVELATATMAPFETSIDEDARTRLRDRYVVSAPLAGRLRRVALREGDVVARDAVVATLAPLLSPMLDQRSLREQQERIGGAEAAVQRARAQVAAARVGRERADVDLRRTEQLAQQGFVAPTKIDADRLAAQAAQKELEATAEALHVAQHDLAQARAAMSAVQASPAGAGFAVRSPVAGRVLKVHQPSETTVAFGAPLIDIGDTARLEVVAELLSSDALQAQPGSAVRIERWGGPALLQGRVRSVEPAAFTKVSALGVEEQRVNVLIDITSPAADWVALGDAYRVGVRVITRSEAHVLCVPVSALFPLAQAPADGGAEASVDDWAAVFVVEQGRAALRPVKLGGRNGRIAWVVQGLQEGARLIVYPPTTLKEGARVAERAK
jgi:HlyD family secretion protein